MTGLNKYLNQKLRYNKKTKFCKIISIKRAFRNLKHKKGLSHYKILKSKRHLDFKNARRA